MPSSAQNLPQPKPGLRTSFSQLATAVKLTQEHWRQCQTCLFAPKYFSNLLCGHYLGL